MTQRTFKQRLYRTLLVLLVITVSSMPTVIGARFVVSKMVPINDRLSAIETHQARIEAQQAQARIESQQANADRRAVGSTAVFDFSSRFGVHHVMMPLGTLAERDASIRRHIEDFMALKKAVESVQ